MQDKIFEQLKKSLPRCQKNIALAGHTTFKIGGPAEYFFVAKTKSEVVAAIGAARKLKLPVFVFGGGSNLLVSDRGVKGLVIKMQIDGVKLLKGNIILAGAGVELKKIVEFSVKKSLVGLEWAGGLPGTFGGAIRGNAGAFGGETKDSIVSVEALDKKLELRSLSNKQCQFSYRSSIFKKKDWIVLFATIQFKKGDKKNLQAVANSHVQYRKERHPLEYPNAGSVFKNVDFKALSPKLQKVFADKVKQDPFPIVPSAWLIIGAGLTGKQIGQAQISKKHSNYIVNKGSAKAEDVIELITFVKKEIKKKYGILLEQEVQYLE